MLKENEHAFIEDVEEQLEEFVNSEREEPMVKYRDIFKKKGG